MANESMTVAQTGVEELYVETAGPVFAYCYARVGSRNLAEWAVTATFDRARAALGNGGIPDPQLDWLLRTADKFCAPSLRMDGEGVSAESVVVLQDWRGRSFDEIEAELRARQARLEEERNRLTPWRRVLGALNLGPALSWAKGLFAGASAVKATAAAVAVVAAIAVVATPLATKLHDAVWPSSGKPAPASGPSVANDGAPSRSPAPASASSGKGAVPAAVAGGAAATGGKPARNGVGSGAGATTSAAPAVLPTGHTSVGTGGQQQQASSGGSAAAQSGPGTTPAGGAAAPGETVKPKPAQNGNQAVSTPNVTPPSVTPAVVTPTVSVPETPTLPSTPEVPTVPSVSTPTATVPAGSTPGAPSVTVPSTPNPPSVSTPSVPAAPPAPTVTPPTVTLPGH